MQCAMRYSKLCRLLSGQGQDVVICTISMFDYIREWNRANIANYKEIYIKVTRETLLERNQKNLYTTGRNVVGVDLPFDEPQASNVVIANDGSETPEAIVSRLEVLFGLAETEAAVEEMMVIHHVRHLHLPQRALLSIK